MHRLSRLPPWGGALVVYALSRVVSTILLAAMFWIATANGWRFASHRAHATFFSFSGSWDASSYRSIAEHGYPSTLPVDAAGHVLQNTWAFLPVYPYVVHALTTVLGVNGTPNGFYAVGAIVSLVAGGVAAVLLSAILRRSIPAPRALFAVALFSLGPLGFLLQTAYAESLFLALLFASLWCLVARRYWLLIPFGVVAAFTRPGVLALSLALGIHFVVRLRGRRITGSAFPWRDRLAIVVAAGLTAAAGLAWPVIASAATRRPDAYLDTELAFWTGFVGRRHFAPLTPWFAMATTYLGVVAGVVLVLLVIAAGVFWLTRRGTRALGADVVGLTASYWLYLVAVFLPQQSLPRLLLPTAPMLGSPVFWGPVSAGEAGSRRRRVALLVGCVVLQAVAIVFLWFVGYP
ncbi:hypothetical protein [Frondihabitans australicus]|uniref:hypothetical protein n=1 Tax=Frondihabitans australicus TaxID=386892 RepID=UPI001FE90191|nr:hypothetical protein [Frondihabitans australicus]